MHAGRLADRQTGTHAGRQVGRQADRQTDRQTDRQAWREADHGGHPAVDLGIRRPVATGTQGQSAMV